MKKFLYHTTMFLILSLIMILGIFFRTLDFITDIAGDFLLFLEKKLDKTRFDPNEYLQDMFSFHEKKSGSEAVDNSLSFVREKVQWLRSKWRDLFRESVVVDNYPQYDEEEAKGKGEVHSSPVGDERSTHSDDEQEPSNLTSKANEGAEEGKDSNNDFAAEVAAQIAASRT